MAVGGEVVNADVLASSRVQSLEDEYCTRPGGGPREVKDGKWKTENGKWSSRPGVEPREVSIKDEHAKQPGK